MKIGLLGGSFNPVHVGHLRLALEVGELLGLDRVDLMPARVSPHKTEEGMLPFDFRARLLDLAASESHLLAVNRCERDLPEPSFTANTLEHLNETGETDNYFFIMGAESFLIFSSWHRWRDIARMSNLVVADRGGYDLDRAVKCGRKLFPGQEVAMVNGTWIDSLGGRKNFFPSGPKAGDFLHQDQGKMDCGPGSFCWLMPDSVLAELDRRCEEVLRVWDK